MKLLLKRILSYFPESLPVGMTAYEQWLADIVELAGPFADKDSMNWAISNMVMHLPPTVGRKPKNYFVKCLRKTACNQLAGQVFIDIKTKQEERVKAEEAAAKQKAEEAALAANPIDQAEATASQQVASDEKPQETAQS